MLLREVWIVLNFSIKSEKDTTIVYLIGAINEFSQSSLDELVERCKGLKKLEINLAGINMVNSCGFRIWVYFIAPFAKGRDVIFDKAPSIIINQINYSAHFYEGCKVKDFYGSLQCPKCGYEASHLFDGYDTYDKALSILEEINCEKCGVSMELEEDPEIFFSFLAKK